MNYKHIIWDWNGTLLNDLDVTIQITNQLLTESNLEILTPDHYRNIFTFPVSDFYQEIGLLEKYEVSEISKKFKVLYQSALKEILLFSNARLVLEELKQMNLQQYILSAFDEKELHQTIKNHGICPYFEQIFGANNTYGLSKIERAQEMISVLRLEPSRMLLIGDTIHDAKVASAIGCDCILFTEGHNSYSRLLSYGLCIDDLSRIPSYIK